MIGRYVVIATRIRQEVAALETVVKRVEKAMQLIASDIDSALPAGPNWHQELLQQMALPLEPIRPAVLSSGAVTALAEYLRFRHVTRNVYATMLDADQMRPLLTQLRPTFTLISIQLLVFAAFLEKLARADA